ncbi:endonuclease/exonuclease/phosphatase family protein [Mammaliicoccus sciuri]|uniref:endonuclease/exonuclease/phosphatase family protein n=1 Tax=Mammaliicoccus sciuri TaxID=1296 RepID=UPI0018DECCDB|nr:endonuclease/exonuclease/phosphatase family protein [Mammaliicoccus sciuri]QPW15196.1 endonuclease/exonuclease/phosphatase family protein [Mammaliicoccus sciuri]
MKKNYIMLNLNLNFNKPSKWIERNTKDIENFVLKYDPDFITFQEFGSNSTNYDASGRQLEETLLEEGYSFVKSIDGKKPVNTRIFYKINLAQFLKMLPAFYEYGFLNRQCGALFKVNNKNVAIYSVHLPLYESVYKKNGKTILINNSFEKKAMWENILEFSKKDSDEIDFKILAGDYNENNLGEKSTLSEKLDILEQYLDPAITEEPTWNKKKLDHIFVSKNLVHEKSEPIKNTVSDHKALMLKFEI